MSKEHQGKGVRGIVFVVVSIGFLVGAFVPLLVDFLADGRVSWSIIVGAALFMSWLIIAPWLILSNNRFAVSWAAAALSVPIFLYLVETSSPTGGWFLPLGLPAAISGLVAIGAIGWLWVHSRLKTWYAASLSFLLIALLSFSEHFLARPYLPQPDPYESVRYLVSFTLLSGSLLLAVVALLGHGFRPFKASGHIRTRIG